MADAIKPPPPAAVRVAGDRQTDKQTDEQKDITIAWSSRVCSGIWI